VAAPAGDGSASRRATNTAGYAVFADIGRKPPPAGAYLRTRVSYAHANHVHLQMPFDRYYMDEADAPAAEAVYRRHSRGDKRDAALVVRIRDGRAVIEALLVDGKPIETFLVEATQ
jgi:hypothetical protein